MTKSRVMMGWVIIILCVILIIISPLLKFIPLIYGIPIFIIGLFILFNKDEDKIEQIKGPSLLEKEKPLGKRKLKESKEIVRRSKK